MGQFMISTNETGKEYIQVARNSEAMKLQLQKENIDIFILNTRVKCSNMIDTNSTTPQMHSFGIAQLQSDALANQLQAEAGVGNLKQVFTTGDLYKSPSLVNFTSFTCHSSSEHRPPHILITAQAKANCTSYHRSNKGFII